MEILEPVAEWQKLAETKEGVKMSAVKSVGAKSATGPATATATGEKTKAAAMAGDGKRRSTRNIAALNG